jgi:formate hydrogenlyase transcriptional activator
MTVLPNAPTICSPIGALPGEDLAALWAFVEGTAEATGDKFFQALVKHLALVLGVSYAFIAEFAGSKSRVRTLAYWTKDRIADNIDFDLDGTPCQDVIGGRLCHHPTGVQQQFPIDRELIELGIDSYLGVPFRDSYGEVLGHLAVFHEQPMPSELRKLFLFQIFAARAAAELTRLRMEHEIKANEQRYRDLFDEAPIAYVYEDTEKRFVSANRAAQKLLGVKPEEVESTIGMSLVAPTEANQAQIQKAFEDIRQGNASRAIGLQTVRVK